MGREYKEGNGRCLYIKTGTSLLKNDKRSLKCTNVLDKNSPLQKFFFFFFAKSESGLNKVTGCYTSRQLWSITNWTGDDQYLNIISYFLFQDKELATKPIKLKIHCNISQYLQHEKGKVNVPLDHNILIEIHKLHSDEIFFNRARFVTHHHLPL